MTTNGHEPLGHLYIGICSNRTGPTWELSKWLEYSTQIFYSRGWYVSKGRAGSSDIEDGRNQLFTFFHNNPVYTHALFLDDDVHGEGEDMWRLVNHPVDALVEPKAETATLASVDDALHDAWAKRPDLRAAEAQARLARAQSTVSRLSWVPTLDGRFTEAWSENTGFSGEPWNGQIGLAARWTLWDGGYRLIDHAQTHSNATLADSAARQAREQVEVDVRQAWAESDRAHAAWVAAERERTLAEENLRLADVSFQAGASTFLDLEDARVSLESARVRELQERMNVHLGALGLQHAIGTL